MTQDIGNEIRLAIDRFIYENEQDKPRSHLGFSVIGRQCPREIWYAWRWFKHQKHIGRMIRLFRRGHMEEARIIEWLSMVGALVEPVDPATGKQWLSSDLGGHYGGSCDGVVSGLDRFGLPGKGVLECKTHNEKSFAKLQTGGVATAKPEHYIQCQSYMHYLGLPWSLYIAVNKNTDELHIEVVYYKPEIALAYRARAVDIMNSFDPPKRISNSSSFWICKMCDFHEVCHHRNENPPERNCRTCIHSVANLETGTWDCALWNNRPIPHDFALKGCDQWTPRA